jgi:hypothetical protein
VSIKECNRETRKLKIKIIYTLPQKGGREVERDKFVSE